MRIPITIACCIFLLTCLILIFSVNMNTTTRNNEVDEGLDDAIELLMTGTKEVNMLTKLSSIGSMQVFYPFGDEAELVIDKEFNYLLIGINDQGYVEAVCCYDKKTNTTYSNSKLGLTRLQKGYVHKYTSSVKYSDLVGDTKESKLRNLGYEMKNNFRVVQVSPGEEICSFELENILYSSKNIMINDVLLYKKNLYSKADLILADALKDEILQHIGSNGTITISVENIDVEDGVVDLVATESYTVVNKAKTIEYRKKIVFREDS